MPALQNAVVIVRYLYALGTSVVPHKAYSPLVVDAYRVLPRPITFESLETVAWRYPQVIQIRRVVQHHQLQLRLSLDSMGPPGNPLPFEYCLSVSISKTPNQRPR